MVFALGFLLAGLGALLFMPVLARRALRLATRRLSMLVPLSIEEVAAGRDGLRAEHAAATRRLEQAIERLVRDKAEAMAEGGRQAGRAAALDAARGALAVRAAILQAERDAAVRAAHEAEAGFGTQTQVLHDALGLAERRGAILNAARAQLADSEARSDERQSTIRGLETRATGQDLRQRRLAAQAATLTEHLKATRAAADVAGHEHRVARAEGALLAARRDMLQAGLDAATAEAASLQARLDARSSEPPRPAGPDDLAALRQALVALAADLHRAGQPRDAAADERPATAAVDGRTNRTGPRRRGRSSSRPPARRPSLEP